MISFIFAAHRKTPLAYIFRLITLALALVLLQPMMVLASDNDAKADALLAKFAQGETMSIREMQNALSQLEQLIDEDDVPRREQLQLLKCWNNPIDNEEDIKNALAIATQMRAQLPATASQHMITDLILCEAWHQQLNGDTNLALANYTRGVKLAYEHEDLKLIADARSLRGALYSYLGDFSLALDDLITAQDLYESLNLTIWANINLADMATSFRRYGDPQSAIRYYTKLKQLFIENNNLIQANIVNADIALALDELGEHQQAIEHFSISQKFYQEQQQPLQAAIMASNIAASLIKLNRINEAEAYLIQASLVITPQHKADYSFMQLFIAQVKFKQANYPEAMTHANLAENTFRAMQNNRGLSQLLQLKSDINAAMKNWQAAYQALAEHTQINDSIDNKTLSQRTTEMRVKFDSRRIEQENKRLIENQMLKEQEYSLHKKNEVLQNIILGLAIFIIVIISIISYKQIKKNRRLQIIARTDHLTQLPNRRYIYNQGKAMFEHAIKHNSAFSVIVFDADHFKKINDNYGHEVGDQALLVIANASVKLLATLEPLSDKTSMNLPMAGRIGGEEFLITLPDFDANQAEKVANELRDKITDAAVTTLPAGLILTVSAGVASVDTERLSQQDKDTALNTDKNFSQLLKRADDALYEAKNAGRNCVKIADPLSH